MDKSRRPGLRLLCTARSYRGTTYTMLLFTGLLTTAALANLVSPSPQGASRGSGWEIRSAIVFVQAPEVNGGSLNARFPEGSRLVRLWPVEPGGTVEPLTSGFFVAADPQVSYDGKRILFAGQLSRGSRWQIWEMNADGSGKRQITKCDGDCLRPAYLPRQRIVFTALSLSDEFATALFVAGLDGSGAHSITFGPADFQVENVLEDGRILASARYPLQEPSSNALSTEFYTLRPDGTGLTALRCNHEKGVFRGMAEEHGHGSLLFVKARAPNRLGGTLARLDRGAIHNRPVSGPGSMLRSPIQLANGELLVAYQEAAENGASTLVSARKFGLYTYDLSRNSLGRSIYADPELHSLDPAVLSPRPAPKYFWSVVNPKLKVGYFICLQSHRTASSHSEELARIPARVRVVMGNTLNSQAEVWKEAPVESDGSFYVAVPADTPVRFQLLDEKGKVLQEQKSWIWVRPGEHRACLGCHEDRSRVPENAIPKILLRFDVPTPIGQRKTTQGGAESSL